MKIVFLLPNNAYKPVGGVKVVLEYANRLARDGYQVEIVYTAYNRWYKGGLLHIAFYMYQYLKARLTKKYLPTWMEVEKSIRQRLVWSLKTYSYPKDAKVVATAVDTAFYLNRYGTQVEDKYYFIQGFESWFVSDRFVRETYCYKIHKIVISQWLRRMVEDEGEKCDVVPNGFDPHFFKQSIDLDKRKPTEIACLYHLDKLKGLDIAFAAFDLVKEKYPDLHVTLFGTPEQPADLPSWYSYYQRPDRDTFNRIYNEAAIFVGSSRKEGWGLTVGEAMQCGCAVACTDNDGYLEMVRHEQTALVSPVDDAKTLAENICRLIADDKLRIEIARRGHEAIQEFDIEKSYQKFKQALGLTSK